MSKIKNIFFSFLLINSVCSIAKLPINSPLAPLKLEKENGGRLDGSPWSLEESLAQKKVTVIFYVDPDVKDKNEGISERLSKRNFSKQKLQYIAVINMAATWLPNFAIASALKKKQQKYPNTLYLKDLNKLGVKTWKVKDDENNVIILDRQGKVIYSFFGQIPTSEFDSIISIIESNLD